MQSEDPEDVNIWESQKVITTTSCKRAHSPQPAGASRLVAEGLGCVLIGWSGSEAHFKEG